MLVCPIEGCIAKEEQDVGQQLGHWGHFRLIVGSCWGSDRVHDKERHLKDWLALKNRLLTFLSGCKSCQEAHVVEKVVLQEPDVFFILANGCDLGMQIFDCPLFHQLLCDLG